MNDLGLALDSYMAVRRALGFKLDRAEYLLRKFVKYMQQQQASIVTTALALDWATQSNNAAPTWAGVASPLCFCWLDSDFAAVRSRLLSSTISIGEQVSSSSMAKARLLRGCLCLAMLDERLLDICNEGVHPHSQHRDRCFLRVGHLIGV